MFSSVPSPKIEESTLVSPSVTPTMPQLRAPQMIRKSASGSSLFSISMSVLSPPWTRSGAKAERCPSCESSQIIPPGGAGVTQGIRTLSIRIRGVDADCRSWTLSRAEGSAPRSRTRPATLPVPGRRREALLVEVALELLELRRVGRVDVLGVGEAARPNLRGVGAHPLDHPLVDLRIALREPGGERSGRDSQEVVEHQHLAIG